MTKMSFIKIKKHISEHKKRYLTISIVLVLFIVLGLGIGGSYLYFKNRPQNPNQETQKNIYVEFVSEVYDKIKENYWEKTEDSDLANLFKLAMEKLLNTPQELKSNDKNGLEKAVELAIEKMDETKKREFIAQLSHLVLVNLKPFGRSALYTRKNEETLKNAVQNVNPEESLYSNLGTNEGASQKELDESYNKKIAELENKPEAEEELKKTEYAYRVLSDEQNKKRYDESKTEPTVLGKLMRPEILYLYIPRISPTTLDDLKRETEKFDKGEKLNALILDLRNNIGGSLDILPYLLGPFIGPDRYAFEIFQQGNYDPFKTKFGWLPSLIRYKKVVILINENTQSSAEVMAATFKKYNVGIVVGTKTKGWGTIEKVYPLDHQINPEETYSIFLVNHLTIRDDNKPIEENGVEPTININDKNWEKQLLDYFNYQELINATKETWSSEPGKI